MKKRMVLFLFILSAINSFIVSQTFLDKFQGIPIIINNWNPQDNPYYDYSHADSIADGLIGMTSTNTDNVYYNQFVDGTRLKVIPYNGTLTKHNTIAKYSEGAYSYWDILSSRYSNGSLAITPNDTLITTVMDQQLNKSVLITRNFADTGRILSSGPGIMEKVGYDIEPPVPNTKEYTRTDSLKIILNTAYSGSVPPITTDSTVICIITTLYKSKNQGEITLGTQIVKVRDLAYDNWVPITSSYNFSAVPGSDLIIKESISLNGDPPKYVPQIDFRIEWKKVDYLNLLVNSITVWDDRGIAVLTSNDIRTEIKRIAVNGDSPTFPSGSSSNSFDSTIIAFHTVDEPECIDNFAVIKEIDKLLNNASGGKVRLFMSIANSWNGRLGNETIGEDPNWKVDEILARTDLVCPSLNAYMFNCPYTPEDNPTLDYKMLNISALINSLERFNSLNKPFFLGIQNGLWISPQNNYCRESPTNERFLYNINIGLLYGAKGFVPMNYFAREHDSITGFYDPDPINTHPYSSLYNLTRDTIKPRLSGLMGKTIKKLIPTAQYAGPNGINENYNVPPSPRYLAPINNEFTNCLDYIMPYNNTTPVNYYIDYGFFRDSTSESTRKYLMIINRYYSESIYHEVSLKSLGGFTNWKLMCYSDTVSTTLQATDGKANFHDTINVGDAKLYSIMPVVMYGGDLQYSETISSSTLSGPMTIQPGATLTITGTYCVNANIIIEPGGNLIVSQGGHLTFASGCSIIWTCPQITLTALIEAMYVAGGTQMTMAPTVIVELHNSISPYALVESDTATLSTAGVGTFCFTSVVNNTPYYIVFKYLNTVETWSAIPLSFTNETLNYDFTSGVGQAYTDGSVDPLAVHSGKACIYSGDCNQDGWVTSDDYTGLDNDNANFDYHLVNDVNGDGWVTSDDYTFIDNNNILFIHKQVPPGAPAIKRIRHQVKLVGNNKL